VVKETIEAAFVSSDKSVTTGKLLKTIEATKSISVTLKEKIDNLQKSHEKYDFKKANCT
jgi:chromosome segregation and condensation protein ScpB